MFLNKLFAIINEHIENESLRNKFQEETEKLGLDMIRVTCLIGIFFFPLFGILDLLVFYEKYFILWALRLIVVFICIINYLLLNSKFVKKNTQKV